MNHATGVAWCVYILSNNNHTLYVGSTNDLFRRLSEHKHKVHETAFTARYTFDRCVYYAFVADEPAARGREKQIKGWTRAKKVALIQSVNANWLDLTPDITELLRLR
jgi:putative endonuclease